MEIKERLYDAVMSGKDLAQAAREVGIPRGTAGKYFYQEWERRRQLRRFESAVKEHPSKILMSDIDVIVFPERRIRNWFWRAGYTTKTTVADFLREHPNRGYPKVSIRAVLIIDEVHGRLLRLWGQKCR